MLAERPVGESPTRVDCPVGAVVILGGGAGDQSAGSPSVQVSVGRSPWGTVWSVREASKSAGCSASELIEPRKRIPTRNGFVGQLEVPSPSDRGEGLCRRPARNWVDSRWTSRGRRRRHADKGEQRKHGSCWGSPRRSRTARAPRISLTNEVAVRPQQGRMGSVKR
jgi:hypothetical protein